MKLDRTPGGECWWGLLVGSADRECWCRVLMESSAAGWDCCLGLCLLVKSAGSVGI